MILTIVETIALIGLIIGLVIGAALLIASIWHEGFRSIHDSEPTPDERRTPSTRDHVTPHERLNLRVRGTRKIAV